MKSQYLPIVLLLIISLTVKAEVTLDGTLGPSGPLPGPDYFIGADLGQQHGGNLFHSFQDFSLSLHESAIFSGPNSVQTVIGRVTGGNPSNIDGLIRSTIPGADMYFLNPYGIMFGPNAQLDVQGSFHASTADYLRLGNGGRFDARQPQESLLTVAPIEAFGFLTHTPAALTTDDSHLSVPDGQTLSLIGGDLRLNGESPIQFDEQGVMAVFARSQLGAASGRINLASVASIGEVIPHKFGLDLTAEGGKITANNTLVEVSGQGSGEVFIRGGQFVMRDAAIQANTMANIDGKTIDLKLTDSVNISGENQAVLSRSFGQGNAGHLVITTPQLEIIGSHLMTSSLAEGNGGDVDIDSQQITMTEGASIGCASIGTGQCGDFRIKATELLSLSGEHKGLYILESMTLLDYPTYIATTAYDGDGGQLTVEAGQLDLAGGLIVTASLGEGEAGHISLLANRVNVSGGGFITTNALVNGEVGNIEIIVKETLSIQGKRAGSFITPTGLAFEENQSNISSFALAGAGGNISISAPTVRIDDEALISASTLGIAKISGKITINAENLSITQGGHIDNSNGVFLGIAFFSGPGNGGAIQIKAKNFTIAGMSRGSPSGVFSDTYSSGQGGNVEIQTHRLTITEGSAISAHSRSTGNAGQITVQADTINITHQGEIGTEAENAAGGNITVITPNLLYLYQGEITTSVGTGEGQGGDITIENPAFVVLDKGLIKAQADAGRGGDIHIQSNQLIQSNDSLVSASSRLGIDGKVDIDSPTVNLEDFLVVLPGGFIENAQLPQPCNIQDLSELSTFQVRTQHEGLLRMPKNFME